jgi:hypothetical protein
MKKLTILNLIIASILFFLSGYILGLGQNINNDVSQIIQTKTLD